VPESSEEQRKAERQAEEEIARGRAEAAKAAHEAEERAKAEREKCQQEVREVLKRSRDAMIAKYGSEDAVRRPKGLERSVRTAYSLATHERYKDRERDGQSGFSWHVSDEGFDPPPELLAAICKPGPFPTTVAAAYSEMQYWDGRIAERRLLEWDEGDWDVLAPECEKRRQLVREAFAYDLRAVDLHEVMLRQRVLIEGIDSFDEDRMKDAILADLDGLAASDKAAETPAVQTTHPSTASARRQEAIRMLSGPDASLSDREIARRLGMSNATVSSLRRRLAEEPMAKAA
jgi:hypothetical protein